MFHHYHRQHHRHSFLHIMAWLGAFLLGWELGRQGFNIPGLKSGDGFIDYPNEPRSQGNSSSTQASAQTHSDENFNNNSGSKPEASTSTIGFAEETSGPSEQPL